MPKAKTRKRPCRICRRWFLPDIRHRERQKTCGNPECRREWHRRQCAKWNRQNKEYFKANRLGKKLGQVNNLPGDVTRVPPPRIRLHLPRQDIQDLIAPEHLVLIEYVIEQIIRRQRMRP